jgi:uncharacterized surface protein with fasciclin (FAS1) repeats
MRVLTLTAAVIAAVVLAVPAGAAPAQQKNIVQTAVAAGQFKTLATLLTKAGLAKTLATTGPYTVFAPTDAAFAKVPKSTLASLAKNKAKLRAVLLYHVVKGSYPAAKVAAASKLTTLEGAALSVNTMGGVKVGGAKVVKANVRATNGVIHVIDRVLLPPAK